MALNSSGPISLGGATVGQSINLELGNSATALASINSTPFRTLAGVASGQITLSNFYGKSANSYWAIVAATTVLDRGISVSVNGVLCLGSGASQDTTYADTIYFFDVDGAFTKSTNCKSYYSTSSGNPKQSYVNWQANNNSTSAPIFYAVTANNFYNPYGFAPFDHTTNTNKFSGNDWKTGTSDGYWYGYNSKCLMTDSSGNVYVVPWNPTRYAGKYTAAQTGYASWTSTGTNRYNYRTSGTDYAPSFFQGSNIGVLRSDNILVIFGCSNGTRVALYTVNTSTGVMVSGSGKVYNTTSRHNANTALCDSSNNIYLVSTNTSGFLTPLVYKFDSSYNASLAKTYAPDSSGSAQAGFYTCAHLYNDVLYLLTTGSSANAMVVVGVNTTTLVPTWTLKLQFSASVGSDYYYYGQGNITATSVGIYVRITLASQLCVLKLPLDGNISGTKTINYPGGGSATVTFTYVTSGSTMCTASSTTFAYDTTVNVPLATQTTGNGAGSTPASANTPTKSTSTF